MGLVINMQIRHTKGENVLFCVWSWDDMQINCSTDFKITRFDWPQVISFGWFPWSYVASLLASQPGSSAATLRRSKNITIYLLLVVLFNIMLMINISLMVKESHVWAVQCIRFVFWWLWTIQLHRCSNIVNIFDVGALVRSEATELPFHRTPS